MLLITDRKPLSEGDEERKKRDLSTCVSELEDCLREVLSDVLEVEMKAVYEDLWQEVKLCCGISHNLIHTHTGYIGYILI